MSASARLPRRVEPHGVDPALGAQRGQQLRRAAACIARPPTNQHGAPPPARVGRPIAIP
jgi:hypothetical protein